MRGSAEILRNYGSTSQGVVLDVASVDDVPLALQYGHQITGFAPVTPPRAGVDAEWTAADPDGRPAEVLWREQRDLTIQEIAEALEMAQDE